jgi:hypothetical protein
VFYKLYLIEKPKSLYLPPKNTFTNQQLVIPYKGTVVYTEEGLALIFLIRDLKPLNLDFYKQLLNASSMAGTRAKQILVYSKIA